MVTAAYRRLPSSLATYARECALFRSGQRCATCPEKGSAACPIRDIEELPSHLLSRTRRAQGVAPSVGSVQLQSHRTLLAGRADLSGGDGSQRSVRAVMSSAAIARRDDGSDDGSLHHSLQAETLVTIERAKDSHSCRPAADTDCPVVRAEAVSGPAPRRGSVSLSSQEGRIMFKEAIAAKSLQAYFSLAEQMVYQEDKALRSVACLAVVLNALKHDPQKTWKPIWRWNTEEVLLCNETGPRSLSVDTVRSQGGLRLHEMVELARNNGARAQAFPAFLAVPSVPSETLALLFKGSGEEMLRSRIQAVCGASAATSDEHLILHMLSPGGEWKFAPVGGFHARSDSVLVLDLDRSASPRWVPIAQVWSSMCEASSDGKTGGYVTVRSAFGDPCRVEDKGLAGAAQHFQAQEESADEAAYTHTNATGTQSSQTYGGQTDIGFCPRVLMSWAEGSVIVDPAVDPAVGGHLQHLQQQELAVLQALATHARKQAPPLQQQPSLKPTALCWRGRIAG